MPPDEMAAAERSRPPRTFSEAKRLLRERIYSDHRITLYCGCTLDEQWALIPGSCGYRPSRESEHAERIEWEHVVPAEAFGHSFVEWRDGHPSCVRKDRRYRGRACARKVSEAFRRMEADMHNLVPVIGELNRRRSNFSPALIEGEARDFGACDVEIANRKFEPRPAIRGEVARTYLYMERTYPGRGIISRKNSRLFAEWNDADPVDAWECERARRIERLGGRDNGVVREACARAGR